MCMGSSKPKEQKPPPPNPPTTFDYSKGARAPLANAPPPNAEAPSASTFGAELGAPEQQ